MLSALTLNAGREQLLYILTGVITRSLIFPMPFARCGNNGASDCSLRWTFWHSSLFVQTWGSKSLPKLLVLRACISSVINRLCQIHPTGFSCFNVFRLVHYVRSTDYPFFSHSHLYFTSYEQPSPGECIRPISQYIRPAFLTPFNVPKASYYGLLLVSGAASKCFRKPLMNSAVALVLALK